MKHETNTVGPIVHCYGDNQGGTLENTKAVLEYIQESMGNGWEIEMGDGARCGLSIILGACLNSLDVAIDLGQNNSKMADKYAELLRVKPVARKAG